METERQRKHENEVKSISLAERVQGSAAEAGGGIGRGTQGRETRRDGGVSTVDSVSVTRDERGGVGAVLKRNIDSYDSRYGNGRTDRENCYSDEVYGSSGSSGSDGMINRGDMKRNTNINDINHIVINTHPIHPTHTDRQANEHERKNSAVLMASERTKNLAVLTAGAMAGLAYVLSSHPLEIASILMQIGEEELVDSLVCRFVCLFVYLFICLFVYLFIFLFVCFFVCLYVHLFVYMLVCLFVCLLVYLLS